VAVRLFLIPFLIVAACAVVVLIYRLLSTGEQSAADYLAEIRSGGGHRRWQAAYELSRVLGREDTPRDPRLAAEMTRLFLDSAGRDPLVRRYLALSLGRVGAREAVPALISALEDSDAETRVYAAWALGAIGDSSAAVPLAGLASDADPGMRKVVAYALGALGASSARPELRAMLEDPIHDVRWNAAVALARFGDDAGRTILAQMIDRTYLRGVPQMTAEQQDEVVLNGVRGIDLLGGAGFDEELSELAARDPSPRVRAAASEARRRLKAAGA
jgi:HEAT repeat protein